MSASTQYKTRKVQGDKRATTAGNQISEQTFSLDTNKYAEQFELVQSRHTIKMQDDALKNLSHSSYQKRPDTVYKL